MGMVFGLCRGASASGKPFTVCIKKVPPAQYPKFIDDLDYERLDKALRGSIVYYQRIPATRLFAIGKDRYSAAQLEKGLAEFLRFTATCPPAAAVNVYIAAHGAVYCAFEKKLPVDVLFTGYFEPRLQGSRSRTDKFRFPVYARPDDLLVERSSVTHSPPGSQPFIGRLVDGRRVPYYDRKTIESTGVLSGKAKVLAWVDDPVALFFLQIQGSGRIVFPDDSVINVHYDISNGRPYRSIGRYLIDHGKIPREKMSMQAIREYLAAHPKEQKTIFDYNPRYVFFRIVKGGPRGCFNIELTPGRSIALDRRVAPPGVLAFIRTEKPVCDASAKIQSWVDFSRFMLNQDTGSAITGTARADIFWGSGAYAETASGYMKQPGWLYFIILTGKGSVHTSTYP